MEDLLRIYRQEELEEDDVQRVMAVLDEVGSQEQAQRVTEAAAGRALAALKPVSLPQWAQTEAENLVMAAESGDKKNIAKSLGALGKTCGSCHNKFRKKKN